MMIPLQATLKMTKLLIRQHTYRKCWHKYNGFNKNENVKSISFYDDDSGKPFLLCARMCEFFKIHCVSQKKR